MRNRLAGTTDLEILARSRRYRGVNDRINPQVVSPIPTAGGDRRFWTVSSRPVHDESLGTAAALAEPWPLVGRELELAQITDAHANGACPGAVIHAPAGVGKSRLAREACTAAETNGELALWAQATASSATIPLGALASLIPERGSV